MMCQVRPAWIHLSQLGNGFADDRKIHENEGPLHILEHYSILDEKRSFPDDRFVFVYSLRIACLETYG
jgi:hypothetical protein